MLNEIWKWVDNALLLAGCAAFKAIVNAKQAGNSEVSRRKNVENTDK